MDNIKINENISHMVGGILLLGMSMAFPMVTQEAWFGSVYKIREAIAAGDSGHLILAAALLSLLCAVQSNMQFLGVILIINYTKFKLSLSKFTISGITFGACILLNYISMVLFSISYEPVVIFLSVAISLFIFERLLHGRNSFIHISIISIQVFFAFQWLTIMPIFTVYQIGQSDMPISIKIAGLYLEAGSVLNFTGFAFFMPFLFSAFITTILFISYSKNIKVMRDNYEKENEIKSMKAKILENKIYMEVKSLVHDLKTPLVTIRGLNSLLTVTKDEEKIVEYCDRIENSVIKMNDMISSFLFEASRQNLKAADLISFIRAQLPIDDDAIKIEMVVEENLPDIYINKIRVARAIINILENAIIVSYTGPYKHIIFEVKAAAGENGLNIIIKDNGTGIKQEDLNRIWEVGFSTNNTSGLGLPFAKQILCDNEGTIDIFSEEGIGTTVDIFLPSSLETNSI
jgi:signal transduction histidine kinase